MEHYYESQDTEIFFWRKIFTKSESIWNVSLNAYTLALETESMLPIEKYVYTSSRCSY